MSYLNKINVQTLVITAICSIFYSDVVQAQAHVHGQGDLNIAIENDAVFIEISMPSGDIIGFEHSPSNEEEMQLVKDTKTKLEDGANLFTISGGECALMQSKVSMNAAGNALDMDDNALGHSTLDEHHHHHDEHTHSHAHAEKSNQHTNIDASYQFTCSSSKDISAMSVNIFEWFPAISSVNAQWISESGQGSMQINAGAKQVIFN